MDIYACLMNLSFCTISMVAIGLLVEELSDGRVIVTQVIPNEPADSAGFGLAPSNGWDDAPIQDAIAGVHLFLARILRSMPGELIKFVS